MDNVEEKAIKLFEKHSESNKLYTNVPGLFRKLSEEVGELSESLMTMDRDGVCEEAADIFILMIDIVNKAGNGSTIIENVHKKLEVLEERWSRNGQIGRNR